MAGGAVLVFLAVAMTARFAVPLLARIVGAPLAWRASGALARDNAMRNAARTARTAAALMIGVGLVIFAAVLVDGLKTSFTDALDTSLKSDLIVTPSDAAGRRHALAAHRARRSRAFPASQVASALNQGDVRRNGRHGGTGERPLRRRSEDVRRRLQVRLGQRAGTPTCATSTARGSCSRRPRRSPCTSASAITVQPALELARDARP